MDDEQDDAREPLKAANQVKATKSIGPPDVPSVNRHSIQCGCGLWRLIPRDAIEGDEFRLVPCPKCGWSPTLRHLRDCVELLDDKQPSTYEGEVPVTPIFRTDTH